MKKQKGSSLLITLLVTAALLSIAFGVSKLSIGETKISRDISKSLIAYFAAEAGVECQMFADRITNIACGTSSVPMCLSTDICVITTVNGFSPDRIIQSNGSYKDVTRSIELKY